MQRKEGREGGREGGREEGRNPCISVTKPFLVLLELDKRAWSDLGAVARAPLLTFL